jgi:hypothetical protein
LVDVDQEVMVPGVLDLRARGCDAHSDDGEPHYEHGRHDIAVRQVGESHGCALGRGRPVVRGPEVAKRNEEQYAAQNPS